MFSMPGTGVWNQDKNFITQHCPVPYKQILTVKKHKIAEKNDQIWQLHFTVYIPGKTFANYEERDYFYGLLRKTFSVV